MKNTMTRKCVNTLKKLIGRNGFDDEKFRKKRKKMLRYLVELNHSLFRGERETIAALKKLNKRLPGKTRGEQQFVYLLKQVEPERKLWKRHMSNLRFRRLTTEELAGKKKWREPRFQKKKKKTAKGKKEAPSFTYVASMKKLLRANGGSVGSAIVETVRQNLPFGSPAFLDPNLRAHHEAVKVRRQYSDHKGMLDHCSFAKIGRGALPRMGHAAFVELHKSFLSTFTLPEKKGKNRMADWQGKMTEAAKRDSDGSDGSDGSNGCSDGCSEEDEYP